MKKKSKYLSIFTILIIMMSTIIGAYYLLKIKKYNSNTYKIDDSLIKYKNDNVINIDGGNFVKVYISKQGKVLEVPIEEYVIGVVSAEMPANFNEEAIKAQAVAARTFYFSKRLNNCKEADTGEICDTTHCEVYLSKEERLKGWAAQDRNANYEKIKKAVESTENEVLTYDGELLKYPEFFATSSGKTESSIDVFNDDVPYLKSIDSPGEEIAPKFESEKTINISEFIKTINKSYKNANIKAADVKSKISKISNTEGGAVKEIKLGNTIVSGTDFRKIFNLNSTNFTIEFADNTVKIECKGYGHGVGMSQWGARVMADEGKTYTEILKHYYSGVEVQKVKLNK